MLYVVFGATFAVAYALSSRALRSHERAVATETVGARSVPTWLAASVWSLVAAVAVTAPVDALSSLVVARAAA